MMEQIIKAAEKKKKQARHQPRSKKEKLDAIRDNKAIEKAANREEEKFDLSPIVAEQTAEIVDFKSHTKVEQQLEKKPSSRLMEKLKRKRDEQFGKDE